MAGVIEKWAKQVTKVLVAIENAMCPELFIAGGGISRKADKWVPLLKNRTPVVAAALQNTAGIVGAAMAATQRRDALIGALWPGYCCAVVTMVSGSRMTESGEYPHR